LATLAAFWAQGGDGPLGPRVRSLPQERIVRLGMAALLAAVAVALLAGETRLANWQTVDTRLQLWRAAARLWRDHLLLGVGPGGFHWSYPAYLAPGDGVEPTLLHPHNVWLEAAAGWGLAGLAWLAALLALWVAGAARVWRAGASRASAWAVAGLTAALAAGLAHAQVDAFLSLPDLAAWLMVGAALVGVMGLETGKK
jgi:O-antigen ligase